MTNFIEFICGAAVLGAAVWTAYQISKLPTAAEPEKQPEPEPTPEPEPEQGDELTAQQELWAAKFTMLSTHRAELLRMLDNVSRDELPLIKLDGYTRLQFSYDALSSLLKTDIENDTAQMRDLLRQIEGQSNGQSSDKPPIFEVRGSGGQTSGQSQNITMTGTAGKAVNGYGRR